MGFSLLCLQREVQYVVGLARPRRKRDLLQGERLAELNVLIYSHVK